MVPRLTSLISLLAWRDQWRFLELTKAHVANGKKMAEIMYSSHNNWVLKVSRLALVLLYFPLWLVHCAFKHFITIFNWVLKVSRIALGLLWFCFGFALVLLYFPLWLVQKNLHHFLKQSDTKLQSILTWSAAFSLYFGQFCCFYSEVFSDWMLWLLSWHSVYQHSYQRIIF